MRSRTRNQAASWLAAATSLDVSGIRVLVVDDDALALSAVQSTLEGWGCIVAAARSSQDALAILASEKPPQILIVDYLLQHGDTGVKLICRIERELKLRVPAIILSGVSSRLLEQEAEHHGCQLLYKPTHPVLLRKAIATSFKQTLSPAKFEEPEQAC